MSYEYIRFLNLQYWYCVIYSLFGGECAVVEPITGQVGIGGSLDAGVSGIPTSTLSTGIPTGVEGLTQSGTFFQSLADSVVFIGTVIAGAAALLWAFYSAVAYTVSGILLVTIFSSLIGVLVIRYRELSLYGPLPRKAAAKNPLKSRWRTLLDHAMSTDPKRWRAGILEVDEMLGEMLLKLGYDGKTTADKMRNVSEGAFVTLPAAWEAHRVRNFVAARSSDYILTQREAFRVMKLYEQVFEEFDFI